MNFYRLWHEVSVPNIIKMTGPDSGIVCYHGSRERGITNLRAGFPPYEGGLGYGVYTALLPQTARVYGNNIYQLRTRFGWNAVFRLDRDAAEDGVMWTDDNHYGHSVLVGEQIQPFFFRLFPPGGDPRRGQIYFVSGRNSDLEHEYGDSVVELELDEIGAEVHAAGYRGLYVEGIRAHTSANEELLVFDPKDLELLRQVE